ncbi:hypothetical protein [Cellvibrio sp. NN19]|uniref:hypothetical protein n=1 Tax=Cellvibrio chitinivorans TaxID=3102792 RepID=UPI002B406F52|nr:hypothetical protein [Cellvibrio sp. NN19]
MKNYSVTEQIHGSIEEEFKDYTIYIENNPDPYREGFEWSICKDNEILESNLAFTVEDAFQEAKTAIDTLLNNTLAE